MDKLAKREIANFRIIKDGEHSRVFLNGEEIFLFAYEVKTSHSEKYGGDPRAAVVTVTFNMIADNIEIVQQDGGKTKCECDAYEQCIDSRNSAFNCLMQQAKDRNF